MSNQPKGGMQFFKKFADKGGSLFGGMKIKGPKEAKNVAQTETSFSFNDKSNEQQKSPQSITRDDISIKQQRKETDHSTTVEIKPEEPIVKKTNSKVSEIIIPAKKVETIEPETKKIDDSPKEIKEIKENLKPEVVQVKPVQIIERTETAQEKKSEKSSPAPVISERKKSERTAPKRNDDAVIRKASMTLKQQRKRQEEDKPKKSDKEQVLDQINQFNVKLAQSVITQKTTQARICEIRESITELREKINHWASQQSLCAQRQEYEEADRLQNRIQESQNKIDELSIEMNFAQDQLLKQESEEINILKTQNTNLKKIGRKLKLIELQLQDDAAVIKREEIEKIQNLKNKQQIERKKIQRIEKDITYQNEQITQFQKMFKQELDSKLNPLFRQKSKLQGDKSDLESEIRELQKKLKEKKGQLSETNKGLKAVNDSIAQINDSFRQESTKLQQRKNKLEIIENEHDQMKLEMDNLDHTIEEQSKSMEIKIEKKLGEAIEMSSLAKSIEQKQLHFDDQLEERRVAFDNFVQNGKILKEFEEKHRSQKDKIKEIEYKKSNITAEIAKLQEKRDLIRKKIPVIQIEQKKFADQKNYKAAGLKKSEIKQLTDELAIVKEKIEAAIIQEHALTIEEEKLTSAQRQNFEEEEALQKNLAISQYKYYSIKVTKMTEYKEAIARNSAYSAKQKEKILKELSDAIFKKTEQLEYLNETYQLSSLVKANPYEEEQELAEADNADIQIDEQSNENRLKGDNNQHEEGGEDLVEEREEERIDEEESGYVPLQLD